MQTFIKKALVVMIIICILIVQGAILGFSTDNIIGQIKEIGIGRIILNNKTIILIEPNTIVENEDGVTIPLNELNVNDAIAVEGSGGDKTIRATKIKKSLPY